MKPEKDFVVNKLNIQDDDFEVSSLYNKQKAEKIGKELKLNVKKQAGTLKENVQVNPNRGDPEYINDCAHATVAFICNEIGLDVEAKPMPDRSPITMNELLGNYFKGAIINPKEPKRKNPYTGETSRNGDNISLVKSRNENDYRKQLAHKILETCDHEKGSAGVIRVDLYNGGHFMQFKINKIGKVKILDSQLNSTSTDIFRRMINGTASTDGIQIARLDNCEIKTKNLLNAVKNREVAKK